MSTRSNIGAIQPGGSVRAIYCHSDGYPEHAGAVLAGHYSTPARLAALLDLGDLSQLHAHLAPADGVPHRFGQPSPGVCVAYGRDRGDTGTEATDYTDAADYWQDAIGPGSGHEFAYLFCPLSGWWVRSSRAPGADYPLSLVLESVTT